MQPEARGCEEAGDSRSGPQWQAGSPQAQTDLVLALAEGEELEGSIEFAAELFRPATAERMARHLEVCALHQMICGTCPRLLYCAWWTQHAHSAIHATLPQVLFANIAAAPDAAVDDLGIMSPDEHRLVMRHTFSPLQLGPAVGAYARQTIHGMLEHWAASTPSAPAAAALVRAARFVQLCAPDSFATAVT